MKAAEADRMISTSRGILNFSKLLEAKTRHAAQHLRQIYIFMRRIGIEPIQELKEEGMKPIKLGQQLF